MFGQQYGVFDVVIDDGSHAMLETLNTFQSFFPYLDSGGIYVIEDWVIGYWAKHDPTRYGHGAMMDNLIADFLINKDSHGIRDFKIIFEAPKCSLAIFNKI